MLVVLGTGAAAVARSMPYCTGHSVAAGDSVEITISMAPQAVQEARLVGFRAP